MGRSKMGCEELTVDEVLSGERRSEDVTIAQSLKGHLKRKSGKKTMEVAIADVVLDFAKRVLGSKGLSKAKCRPAIELADGMAHESISSKKLGLRIQLPFGVKELLEQRCGVPLDVIVANLIRQFDTFKPILQN